MPANVICVNNFLEFIINDSDMLELIELLKRLHEKRLPRESSKKSVARGVARKEDKKGEKIMSGDREVEMLRLDNLLAYLEGRIESLETAVELIDNGMQDIDDRIEDLYCRLDDLRRSSSS